MTPRAWFLQNINKAVTVPGAKSNEAGQCWVTTCGYLHDVYSLPYIYTSAALNVWNDSLLSPYGFIKIAAGQPIFEGDLIFYDARIGASQGHVDIASQSGNIHDFYAYDSNWDKLHFHDADNLPTLHEVHHADTFNNYIVGYYRPAGGKGAGTTSQQEDFIMNDDEAKDLWRLGLHREPENDQVWRPWVGKRFSAGSDAFRSSDEWLAQNHILLKAYPEAMQGLKDLQAQLTDMTAKAQVQQVIERCTVDLNSLPAADANWLVSFVNWIRGKDK